MTLPAGVKLISGPYKKEVKGPGVRFVGRVWQKGRLLYLRSRLVVGKRTYPAADYAVLRKAVLAFLAFGKKRHLLVRR